MIVVMKVRVVVVMVVMVVWNGGVDADPPVPRPGVVCAWRTAVSGLPSTLAGPTPPSSQCCPRLWRVNTTHGSHNWMRGETRIRARGQRVKISALI